MRLWSLHPVLLDSAGLVAAWREALLAKKVLEGKTKGYKQHPQLVRFLQSPEPLVAINYYLKIIAEDAVRRHYNFDSSKIESFTIPSWKITVSNDQLDFEFQHLLAKTLKRDTSQYTKLMHTSACPHPLFEPIVGPIEPWERII